MRRRFEREAQVIAQLRSPHTVTLFDFGVAEEGSFYYVMELLDGVDTDTLIRRFGPIPAERVVHILRQMCHSLSEAESCGLVHRDIKPANIFLCRYGEDHDFVKVLDFGIAKVAHETSSETQTAITIPNVIQGTPAFIAPEQALGGTDVDARADIYSTGCVAYWLLTGQLVFTADTPMKLLLAHAHTPPEPPSVENRDSRFHPTWRRWCCPASPRIATIGRSRPGISSSDSMRSRFTNRGPTHALVTGGRPICHSSDGASKFVLHCSTGRRWGDGENDERRNRLQGGRATIDGG